MKRSNKALVLATVTYTTVAVIAFVLSRYAGARWGAREAQTSVSSIDGRPFHVLGPRSPRSLSSAEAIKGLLDVRGGQSFGSLLPQLLESKPQDARAYRMIMQLNAPEIDELLDHLRDSPANQTTDALARIAFERLGQLEATRALERVLAANQPRKFIGPVVSGWASRDPVAAFAWYQDRPLFVEEFLGISGCAGLAAKIFVNWVAQDPLPALDAIANKLTSREREKSYTALGTLMAAGTHREKLTDRLLDFPDPELGTALERMAGPWASRDPGGLAAWLDEETRLSSRHRQLVAKRLLRTWHRLNPDAAARWSKQNPDAAP